MKVVKRLALIVVLLAILASLNACKELDPTQTTDTFMQAIKKQDEKMLTSVYSGGSFDILNMIMGSDEETFDSDSTVISMIKGFISSKLLNYDYELSNEQIDGNFASVDVTINTYSIGDAVTSFLGENAGSSLIESIFGSGASGLLSGLTGDAIDLGDKNYRQTVTLSLTKAGGRWMVDQVPVGGEFVDAISGGLVTALYDIGDILNVPGL